MITADITSTASATGIRFRQGDEDVFADWTPDLRPVHIPWLYRMRELNGYAPSQRAAVLRQALRGTRRHAAFARQCAIGAAFAAAAGLLLVEYSPHAPIDITAVGIAFAAAMLFERRRSVKRRLRTRLARDHAAARSITSRPLPFA